MYHSRGRERAGRSSPPFLSWWLVLTITGAIATGCVMFASAPPEKVRLRPAPSRLPTQTVSGRTVIATPGPISVAVRPLDPDEVERYFRRRSTRVNPFQEFEEGITPFSLRIENRSEHQLTFDPGLAILRDNENRGSPAMDVAEFFEMFSDQPSLLQAAQRGVFTGYVVVPSNRNREGLLIFRPYAKDAKALFLQFTSLYTGPTAYPLIFEFEVVPEQPGK
ncbi:MAG: hypothetical protein ACE5K9_12810 [Candidatus Methylomirabilales bacterium]